MNISTLTTATGFWGCSPLFLLCAVVMQTLTAATVIVGFGFPYTSTVRRSYAPLKEAEE